MSAEPGSITRHADHFVPIAHYIERARPKRQVAGESPAGDTIFIGFWPWQTCSVLDVIPKPAGISPVSALSTQTEWMHFLKSFAVALQTNEWPGNPAASEEHLLKAENRLKTTLPPSYRAFLSASNGWRNASRAVPLLRPIEKIRWFKREHRDWVLAYTDPMQGVEPLLPAEQDYFNYSQQDSVNFDVKHLAQALCISDVGDSAVLLLNPMVVWPDGEWEAWFFANWLPGATRYRSFADWMRHELAELRDEEFTHSVIPDELPTVYLDGPTKETRRVRPREVILTMDEAIKKLTSKTRSQRVKAVRQLGRIGGEAAISKLIDLLKADYDYHVRCEAAEVLGRMRSQEAIEPLIAVTAEESYVTSTAIQALGNFNDEPSAQRLLKLVEEDGPSAGVATYALAKRNDSRGVPLLVQKLTSKDWRDQHTGNIAGRFIAEFGKKGFQALAPLLESRDVEIRQRAINGIFDLACLAKDKDVKAEAKQLLERCFQNETDPAVRQNLEACLAVACNKKSPHLDNPFATD